MLLLFLERSERTGAKTPEAIPKVVQVLTSVVVVDNDDDCDDDDDDSLSSNHVDCCLLGYYMHLLARRTQLALRRSVINSAAPTKWLDRCYVVRGQRGRRR